MSGSHTAIQSLTTPERVRLDRSVWRNRIARGTSNPKVAGSIPVTDSLIFLASIRRGFSSKEERPAQSWRGVGSTPTTPDAGRDGY